MAAGQSHSIQASSTTTSSCRRFSFRPRCQERRRRWPSPCAGATRSSSAPRETKRLSDIDDQQTLRSHVPVFFFYRGGGPRHTDDDDPAPAVRRAVGQALVSYYPLAGRLRETETEEGRKLVVECTGEGVLFVEADADARLAELQPGVTFPWIDQFLSDVEGSSGVLNCPLLLIQVTRLLCGGVVLALRVNHAVCDATGTAQFMSAVAELARGVPAPTVAPVWSRHLLEARSPPTPTFPHREYDAVPLPPPPPAPPAAGDVVVRAFNFSKADIGVIREALPPRLRDRATTYEVLAGAVWRARTAALEIAADEDVRLAVIANFRGLPELGLPAGYYGNACVALMAVTTAGALRDGSVGNAVELVREVKAAMTAEYVRSTADFLVLHGRPLVALANLFVLSDTRYAGFHCVDFGWGEHVYGGPVKTPLNGNFLVTVKNDQGEEDAVAISIALPQRAMDKFASQVEMLVKKD
ncbi:hypothetical protein U9M48_041875 [Paspalum notatum var. saurae]|uniref:Uncharacterized protein n=1 Tax=Paspalum notatum var. saurae TaxID=547442 RepID=A0AAQ3XEP5_PASNO